MRSRAELLVLIALVVPGLDAAGVSITLRDRGDLRAAEARLGDIAEITGDAGLRQRIETVVVQSLHDSARYTITPSDVRVALADVVPVHRLRITGEAVVRRAIDEYDSAAVAAAARDHLARWIGDAVEFEVALRRVSGPLSTPSLAERPTRLEAEPLVNDPWGEVPYRVRLLRGEDELARGLVVLESSAMRRQPVASRELPAEHALALHDLRLERQRVRDDDAVDAPSVEDLVGRVLRNTVHEGDVVDMADTRPPTLVHGGAQVTLVYQHRDFVITVLGTALSDGSLDDLVRVRQPNGHSVRARVTGPSEVLINY